ncbi:uncharacterized protein LOC109921113 [Rhincodon typus]|uniref:uncharacterized protein LOC109921113 n=1 Tax=Rhincodon typus TaxID=259920 RepID=UPI00202FE8C0|nr:uncharacterized protein LOC109921113 [Rhincodon typus]
MWTCRVQPLWPFMGGNVIEDLTEQLFKGGAPTLNPAKVLSLVCRRHRVTGSHLKVSDFLRHSRQQLHLGTSGPETADVETLRLEVIELRQKYELLLEENKELKAKLAQFEPPKEEGQPE